MNCSLEKRQAWIDELENTIYDVAVMGGGITGAGIAMQAARLGLKVLLVEKNDFASGTSSQSSKLVHGGLRYLQQYDFGLVHTALKERYFLLKNAPHIVHRLPFVLPIYQDSPDGYLKLHLGLYFYDALCGFHPIGRHHMVPKNRLEFKLPSLNQEGLKAAANYFDAQGDDCRLVLASLWTAVQHHAHILNYFEINKINTKQGKVQSLSGRDKLSKQSYTIRARVYVNATGAWSDQVRQLASDKAMAPRVRNTKGVHMVVPRQRLPIQEAVMIFSVVDGRTMFAIPWEEATLLGTTDDDYDQVLDDVYATKREINYLLASFNAAFKEASLTEADILSTLAGLRPLVLKKNIHASEVSREHELFEHPANLYNMIGGKLTTYIKMADDLIKKIHKKFPQLKGAYTLPALAPLVGSQGDLSELETKLRHTTKWDEPLIQALIKRYGTQALTVAELASKNRKLNQKLTPVGDVILAEVDYGLAHEMMTSAADFIMRRTRMFYFDKQHGREQAVRVVERMAELLNWSKEEKLRQMDEVVYFCQQNDRYRF